MSKTRLKYPGRISRSKGFRSLRKHAGTPTLSAVVLDAIKSTSIALPQTRKVFNVITQDLITHRARFNEQMEKVEEEIASGCRRTKGDII